MNSRHEAVVTALFDNAPAVERAFGAALALGYEPAEVNLLLSEETRRRLFGPGQVTESVAERAQAGARYGSSKEAAALGGPTGGTAGTLAPAAAAIGAALLIPNLVLAGPVAIALAAAGAVGVAGGALGALTHWGIPKHRIEDYEQGVREGGILVGVKPRSAEDASRLQEQWRAAGGKVLED
jgi:hypothetical protein